MSSTKRDSFIFYRSFYECSEALSPEQKAIMFDAICQYSLNFKEPELDGIVKSLFVLIKPNLEANNKRYKSGKQPKVKQNISKKEAKPKRTKSKPEANKDKDKDVDKDKDKDENKEYVYPPFLEFLEHAKSKVPKIDPDDLKKKYDAWVHNDWHDGNGVKIVNWKLKLNNTIPFIKVKTFTPPI